MPNTYAEWYNNAHPIDPKQALMARWGYRGGVTDTPNLRSQYNQYLNDPATKLGDMQTSPINLDLLNSYLKNAYGVASANLFGQQRRAIGLAGQQGAAQGYASGLNNPNLLSERARSFAQNQWANQSGDLASQYMMGLAGNPLKAFGTQLSAYGQNANIWQQYLNYLLQKKQYEDSQSFGGQAGKFLGGAVPLLFG